ncbi:MAG: metal-dependent phosphohydrolase [Cyanobacteria bacterium REEB459]|nr:metal-dependent phosphohydrolase [Cyanobacteria bacterium REEB459]
MFNTTEILINSFVAHLKAGYQRNYGSQNPQYQEIIGWAGSMALENIANSDALYHNVEHTILVTLVGQEILWGKHIREGGVSSQDWLHVILSLVCHDIGYIKGVCRSDQAQRHLYATGRGEDMVKLLPGNSDAALSPYHVDRGKRFIEERFGDNQLISAELIQQNIELTRFPVPDQADLPDTQSFPALVRAADLIGQLSDPRYLKKVAAIFYEFEETGLNQQLGYHNPDDLRAQYPQFYWSRVHPFIQDGLRYLSLTQQGKQILANLYSNVFMVENQETLIYA